MTRYFFVRYADSKIHPNYCDVKKVSIEAVKEGKAIPQVGEEMNATCFRTHKITCDDCSSFPGIATEVTEIDEKIKEIIEAMAVSNSKLEDMLGDEVAELLRHKAGIIYRD